MFEWMLQASSNLQKSKSGGILNSTGIILKIGLLEEIRIAISTGKIQNPTGRDRNFDSERHKRKKVKRESVTSPKVYGI